jgi:uncharacterized membrane protein YfcA
MTDAKAGLLTLLAALGLWFVMRWYAIERKSPARTLSMTRRSWLARIGVGVITDFLDTLGVGSFATTSSLFRLGKMVSDENIPGTMNAGHTLPTLAQAFIYVAIIKVDMTTLATMIAASVAGAYVGAGIVSGWSRRRIQGGMGALLIVAASIIVLRQLQLIPGGGIAQGLTGLPLLIGIAGNFVLGTLMTLGIGLYAPCIILVSLLSMSPQVAFPIMMGSCAFLMPVASIRFIKKQRYDLWATLGLTLGGVPAVLVAAYVVRSLPLTVVQWLVVAIVLYTAVGLLRSAFARHAPKE